MSLEKIDNPFNIFFSEEALAFKEGVLYSHCKNCNKWYIDSSSHNCPAVKPLWQRLYIEWRHTKDSSIRKRVLLDAWTKELGFVVIEVNPIESGTQILML